MPLKTALSLLCLLVSSCSSDSSLLSPLSSISAVDSSIVGSPLITIPTVADENKLKLTFSSKMKFETIDERTDKLGLGASSARLAAEPMFSIRFALERTIRSLGFKIGDDGTVGLAAQLLRLELLPSKTPELAQAYIRMTFTVKDPLGNALLTRDYEGSSGSNGSPEQKLGAAISDLLSQVSIDKELQTMLASF